jgi:hypothetical protein
MGSADEYACYAESSPDLRTPVLLHTTPQQRPRMKESRWGGVEWIFPDLFEIAQRKRYPTTARPIPRTTAFAGGGVYVTNAYEANIQSSKCMYADQLLPELSLGTVNAAYCAR